MTCLYMSEVTSLQITICLFLHPTVGFLLSYAPSNLCVSNSLHMNIFNYLSKQLLEEMNLAYGYASMIS